MIIHVIKDDIPSYASATCGMWEAYSDDGKFIGAESRLSVFRNIHNPKIMHRGFNAEKAPVNIVNLMSLYPFQVKAWWYEIP